MDSWLQDDPIEDTLHRLVNTVRHAHSINPNLDVEVFIHKVQGARYKVHPYVDHGRIDLFRVG